MPDPIDSTDARPVDPPTVQSAVWPPPPSNQPDPVHASFQTDFPSIAKHQSALLLFFLTFVTLGIYECVWLQRNAKALLERYPEDPVPFGRIVSCFAFTIVGAILVVASIFSDSVPLDKISSMIGRIGNVIILITTFQVRNRMNILIGPEKGKGQWLTPVWTFLLGCIYIQHKINKRIESGQ